MGCWSHARRKFDEALQTLPKEDRKNSLAATGECYCTRLFQLENGLNPYRYLLRVLENALRVEQDDDLCVTHLTLANAPDECKTPSCEDVRLNISLTLRSVNRKD